MWGVVIGLILMGGIGYAAYRICKEEREAQEEIAKVLEIFERMKK